MAKKCLAGEDGRFTFGVLSVGVNFLVSVKNKLVRKPKDFVTRLIVEEGAMRA